MLYFAPQIETDMMYLIIMKSTLFLVQWIDTEGTNQDRLTNRGLKSLYLNVVLNHTSDQHPWFLESVK